MIRTLQSSSAIKLILTLGVSMQCWSAAHAQATTTPPVVVSGKGTTLDITPGGTPIVNVAAPTGLGPSYNVFSRLDVGPEGLIFNNSGGISQSVIAGQILANPNLRPVTSKGKTTYPTPAELIVAEVLGGSRSNLRGPMEIVGRKAGLVIANPAGITCDGCGFINASRATLTTGVPTRDSYNRLTGFAVNGGTVNVTGRGLSAASIDFFDIVTASAQINADIYAGELLITGGTGSFSYSNNTTTATGPNSGQLAIDSTVLGGMYANRIRLLGTGAGVGINLRGVVNALDGQVVIAADGNINLRRVDTIGDVTIISRAGSVRVEEIISSGGATIINAATDIVIANNQSALDETTETFYTFVALNSLDDYGYCNGPLPVGNGYCEANSYSPIALAGASIDALGTVILASGRNISHVNRGSISGDSVSLIANQDIHIGGGAGIFANNLALNAVRDVDLTAITSVRGSSQYTDLGRGLYRNTFLTRTEVTGAQLDAFGSLFVTAGRDISLEAASLTADGVIGLTGARDIAIGGIASTGTTTESWKTGRNTTGSSVETVSNYDGTNVAAGLGLYVNASEELDVTGSALRSEGGIDMRAGQGTAYIAGSDVAATGNLVLTGRDIVVTGSVNSSTFDETVRTVKRGFLSRRTTTSVTSNQIETVFASSISGTRVVLDSAREIGILDSDIAGDQAVDITAGGNITIGSIPTTSDYFSSTKVKKVGFSISSDGVFLGISKTSNVVDTTQVTNIGSLIGAASGAVRISAGAGSGGTGLPGTGDLDIVGSRIAALDAVTLSGDTVDIVNNVNLTTTRTSFSSFSLGYTYSVQSPLINSATSLVRLGDIATNTSNARIQAVSALAAGLAIKNGYDAAADVVDTIRTGDGSLGVTLTQSLGYTRTTSTSLLAEETIVASQVAGGDVTIFARGGTGQSGISIFGSDVAATRDLSVFSNAGIDVGAAVETDRYSGQTSSTGISLSISTGLGLSRQYGLAFSPPTITLAFNSSSSRYNRVDVTARAAILGAGGTATINTPGRLNIDGSQISANRVLIDVGALNITSRQNTSNYLSRERSVGLSISYQLGTGNISAAANFAGGNSFGSFATVADQAGIRAGAGGFDINVGGLTELRGGIIASTAAGGLNRLSTATFRASSVANDERYSVYSYNFGLGFGDIGFNSNSGQTTSNGSGTTLPGIRTPYGTLSFSLPTFLWASGSQSSATNSAISPAAVLIGSGEAASLAALGTLSRDTSGANSALTRQFTEAQRAEIAQGFDAARQLTNEVTVFFANRAADQQRAEASAIAAGVQTEVVRDANGNPVNDANGNPVWRPVRDGNGNFIAINTAAQPFIDAAAALRRNYGSRSASRILATALSSAAGSNAAGSLGSFAQAAAVNVLQSYAVNRVKLIADSFLDANGNPTVRSEAVRTALQALVGCAGAAPTGNCGSGALGAASSVVLNNLVTALADPEERNIPRSLADQEARSNLIATLTGAIAGALGANAGTASTAGLIETQNNSIAGRSGRQILPDPVAVPPGSNAFAINFGRVVNLSRYDAGAYEDLIALFIDRAICSRGDDCEIQAQEKLAILSGYTPARIIEEGGQAALIGTINDRYYDLRSSLGLDVTLEQRRSVVAAVFIFNLPELDARVYITKRGYSLDRAVQLFQQNLGRNPFDPLNSDNYRSYTVKSGDTLTRIVASIPNASAYDLYVLNGGIDPNALQAGQMIRIPTAQHVESSSSAVLRIVRLNHFIQTNGSLPSNVADAPPFAGEAAAVAEVRSAGTLLADAWLGRLRDGATITASPNRGNVAVGNPSLRVAAGVILDPRLPEPVAGIAYTPSRLTGGTAANQQSQINGYRAELALANTLAATPGQSVVYYGSNVNSRGADVISVRSDGTVSLWDTKFRSNPTNIPESATFTNSTTRARAVEQAIQAIRTNITLPPAVRAQAVLNLQDGNFNAHTPGAGAARNSVIMRFCNGVRCGN